MPEVRACARRVREAGAWSVNASDGDLWPVIDDFLGGCEVDAYLEIDMSAGMDLARLKAAWGDRITFLGNMDCGRILSFASPEEIRGVTLGILDAGWGNGGHVFTASNAITASVPLGQLPRHGERVQGEVRPADASSLSRCSRPALRPARGVLLAGPHHGAQVLQGGHPGHAAAGGEDDAGLEAAVRAVSACTRA